jgi:hypothetical protein
LHGNELLQAGYTIDQVVHTYGDVCQAITELAHDRNAPVAINEFKTLNRMLDNAIADAVTSYGRHDDKAKRVQGSLDLNERMTALADEQRPFLDMALKALDALKVGNIGLAGATGTLLERSLLHARNLIDKSMFPEIRLASRLTTPPKR